MIVSMTQPLTRPILSSLSDAISAVFSGFNPRNLFAANEPGYLYDLDDLSTVFLDSAGTTPATVNGLVGLVLDKSKGLALEAELLPTLDFTTWADVASVTSKGVSSFTTSGTGGIWLNLGLQQGTCYQITISGTTTGFLEIRNNAESSGFFVNGSFSTTSKVIWGAGTYIYLNTVDAAVVSISGLSIKKISGNHRYQGTTGSKPILRGTPTGANLASGASWTAGTGWSIAGDTATATTSSGALTAASIAAVVGKHYRVTYTITRTAGSIQPTLGGRTGTARSASGTYVQYFDNATSTAALVFTGTGFSGTVTLNTIEAVDISAGSVAAPYALQYDGVDDFLQTASADFSATDKVTVCHGVRKLSDAAAGILVEQSANINLNNGCIYIAAPSAVNTFDFASKGTGIVVVSRSPYVSPVSAVITMASNITAPTLDTRVNTVASVTSTSSQGTGNFGNHPFYFGRRGGASLPFNGLEYSSVCIGRLLTAAELANTERWVGRKTGVTL